MTTVLALLLWTATPTSALEQARAALDAENPKAALELLDAPTPPLDDYRALVRARAHLALGEPDKARSELTAMRRAPQGAARCKPGCEHPLYEAAQTLVAQSFAATEPARAAKILANLAPSGASLQTAAALARQAKQPKMAAEAELRMLTEVPADPESLALAKALGPAGVDKRLKSADQVMTRLWGLLEAHANVEALAEAKAQRRGDACARAYIEGKASRKLRKYAGAVDALSQARKRCAQGSKLWMRSALLEVQVRAIRSDVAGTRKLALLIADKYPDHSFADDALMRYAHLLTVQRQPKDARKVYLRIVDKHPDGDQRGLAAWRLAFEHIDEGRLEDAREWLDAMPKVGRDSARAAYWSARSYDKTDKAKAVALYRHAVFTPPLTFYAWLALDRLESVDPKAATSVKDVLRGWRVQSKTSSTAAQARAALRTSPPFVRAAALAEIGWTDEAKAELALMDHASLTLEEVIELALAFYDTGAHRESQLILRTRAHQALLEPDGPPDLRLWRAAYSRPFEDELKAATKAAGVEPLLLFALSREESTFDPEIVSWAGAVGLTQLMPATAVGAYADVYRKRLVDMATLTDPALNLRLGAHVLVSGMKRFDGEVPLALAAYNGGPGLARRTMPVRQARPFDVWVETISVKETRRYVKKVIGTWGKYRFLYDDKEPFIDLPDQIGPRPVRKRSNGRY